MGHPTPVPPWSAHRRGRAPRPRSAHTMFDEASAAFAELLAIKHEMHSLEANLGDPSIPEAEHDAMLHRYSDLQERFRLHDGYAIELKTATVLQGLGFKPSDFERPTETFSGGWQMRIALAKLLLHQPNLLLLDEPTNHLDLEARNWLEEYLTQYPRAVILVSHDRFFLAHVVTRLARLTPPTRRAPPPARVGRLRRQPQPVSRRARSAHRADAKGEARTGRGSRPRQDVHR